MMALALYNDTSEQVSGNSFDISELLDIFSKINEEESKITEEIREYFFLY
ncbi:MAG: hypothetical protein H7844_07445 [Nitrospirae bacterium YQR-1]